MGAAVSLVFFVEPLMKVMGNVRAVILVLDYKKGEFALILGS
jgi:hypothetical protein